VALNVHREAARAFFEVLERELLADEVLADRKCVAMVVEKAEPPHAAATPNPYHPERDFRNK
jgi:hypothetical protein